MQNTSPWRWTRTWSLIEGFWVLPFNRLQVVELAAMPILLNTVLIFFFSFISAGLISQLLMPRPSDVSTDGFRQWNLTSAQFWKEDPSGLWSLSLSIHPVATTGTGSHTNDVHQGFLHSCSLIVFGYWFVLNKNKESKKRNSFVRLPIRKEALIVP